MNQKENLIAIARDIIDSNLYMVLGTADKNGQPWVSPVYYSVSQYKEFYWVSSPEAKHSRNLSKCSQISIVIFDSQVSVGEGQAVYMLAKAAEVTESNIEHGLMIYNRQFPQPARQGVRIIKPVEVRSPALYRLYQAVATKHWVLDPEARPDRRTPVKI